MVLYVTSAEANNLPNPFRDYRNMVSRLQFVVRSKLCVAQMKQYSPQGKIGGGCPVPGVPVLRDLIRWYLHLRRVISL